MKQFGKILKFELMGYLKNKVFVGITIFLVVAMAIGMFLPNIISAFTNSSTPDEPENLPVMLVSSSDEELSETVKAYFSQAFVGYNVMVSGNSVEDVEKEVLNGNADCAFVMTNEDSYIYYVNNLSMYDTNTQIADAVLEEVYRVRKMAQNGLTEEQINAILSTQIKSEIKVLGKDQMQNFLYTYIMIFALYTVILLYGQMVATNVATEKSSRAMELLVTSAKPISMMFGKVLASCIAGFSQIVIIFGSAMLLYNLNSKNLSNPIISSIFDIPMNLFLYMIVFFILGFLIYAFMFGAIGSTASKLEDINTSVMPITFLFVFAFIVVVFSMSGGSVDNMLMKICSYIPFTSPMAMFTRIAMSTVLWYEIVASVIILIASVIGVGVLSARIYRVGVLLYGTPPKISAIMKSVFSSKHQ